MRLKILVFPTLIILGLVLIFGYIKPGVSDILVKRDTLKTKQAELARMEGVLQNIGQLSGELNQRKDGEAFVDRYLPKALEEERVVDTLNFLAQQSGIALTALIMKENAVEQRQLSPQIERASASFQALSTSDPNAYLAESPGTRTYSYNAKVKALGNYENLKAFLSRLYKTDRFHETGLFSIKAVDENGSSDVTNDDIVTTSGDVLEVELSADFVHFPVTHLSSALNQEFFQEPKFDFSSLDQLLARVTSPVPALDANSTGRPNPFQ